MKVNRLIAVGIWVVYPCAFSLAFAQVNRAAGKFYIVGMGTAPDLMTLRAQKVISRADILLAEEGSFKGEWSRFTQGKEVWKWPHNLHCHGRHETGNFLVSHRNFIRREVLIQHLTT
jgi:hypothetical protein